MRDAIFLLSCLRIFLGLKDRAKTDPLCGWGWRRRLNLPRLNNPALARSPSMARPLSQAA